MYCGDAMKAPKPLPRISAKKLKSLGGSVPFSSITGKRGELARKTPVAKKNAKRKRKAFQRAYGGTERVEWTKMQACVACGAKQQIEVAHTVTGGMGRKANASTTVPLCSWCHAELHRVGVGTFAIRFSVSLRDAAAATEKAWQDHINRGEA